jgi:hypothetical protein
VGNTPESPDSYECQEVNNEAATRHMSSKPAPSIFVYVGAPSGAMLSFERVVAKSIAAEAAPTMKRKRRNGCRNPRHRTGFVWEGVHDNNEAETRQQPSEPAPFKRLCVGGAFMPDALSQRDEKHRG